MISDHDFHLAVGQRLKRLRLALGKSQLEIARKLSVGATAVSNYENGTRAIDPFHAYKLKAAYGVPFEWLFSGDESTLSPHLAAKLEEPTKPRGSTEAEPLSIEPRSKARQRR